MLEEEEAVVMEDEETKHHEHEEEEDVAVYSNVKDIMAESWRLLHSGVVYGYNVSWSHQLWLTLWTNDGFKFLWMNFGTDIL